MNFKEQALKAHKENSGKIEVNSKVSVKNNEDLALAYTPGVAEACKEINKDKENSWEYTSRNNLVAVVTDGSAVLGLGDIGPEASMPVMEGKAVLFKEFAGVDGFPICLETNDVDDIVKTVKLMAPTWGGINLEDISAPRCFEIERRLKEETDLPIFHDDQHGTAVVAAAGVLNALKTVNKKLEDIKVVVNGAGASGVAIAKLFLDLQVNDVIICDSRGVIYKDRQDGMNWVKEELVEITNKQNITGDLSDALQGSDVFLGVSKPETINKEMVSLMNEDPIVFAMANPIPEIYPDEAKLGGAKVVGTGRSDFPNQINNVLAFPGIFRGALDVQATDINEKMKIAAAYAIAEIINEKDLNSDYVIPDPFNKVVAKQVAKEVAKAAVESGINRKPIPETYK
ncbi:NAD(P)-dependent malic enzyme [Natranaerobius trueperi]|uniref:NAD-dependent malic enzyme n=1 Tax=Natranaerobius trueperi TaxID=759412 RepID=A0A226BZN5_9FIRM|nr:malic enzyme-like NAD(P)-binding protein [Natranaerobius trueperi]OWZ84405.1 NAD-dependent malic enzyme [Natranaerobius trueperi]